MTRSLPAVAALALLAAACGGGHSGDATDSTDLATTSSSSVVATSTTVGAGSARGPLPEGPSALDDPRSPLFPPPLVDVDQIISGGPPPDGIPAIDAPSFIGVDEADEWLQDEEAVVVIEIDGDARAYPIQILIWHEIVNDVIAEIPVSVTYCPLCNSAVTYERIISGVETTFGTSGRLFSSALVMYDRATESLWTHFDGRAVVGVLAGTQLEAIPSPLIAWSEFKATYPGGRVLDRSATGFSRPYGDNPYVGYDDPDSFPFLFRGVVDDRAAAMQRVVGVALPDAAAAWTLSAISGGEARATNADLAGSPIVIFWKSGQSSALDERSIPGGSDVGSVGVFDPVVDGRTLTFSAEGGVFVDAETLSTWDITGRATAGELAGTQLARIVHLDTFWFAWSTYRPGTALFTE